MSATMDPSAIPATCPAPPDFQIEGGMGDVNGNKLARRDRGGRFPWGVPVGVDGLLVADEEEWVEVGVDPE